MGDGAFDGGVVDAGLGAVFVFKPCSDVSNMVHWALHWLGKLEWVGGGRTRTCSLLIGAAEGVFDFIHES